MTRTKRCFEVFLLQIREDLNMLYHDNVRVKEGGPVVDGGIKSKDEILSLRHWAIPDQHKLDLK